MRELEITKSLRSRSVVAMGMPIPTFFLLLLTVQLFFTPGFMKQSGQLYVPFKKIVVGGSPNNPPYEFLDENNEPAGYNVDLTRAIAAEMKYEVKIRLGPRESMESDFIDGKIDLLQGITHTDKLTDEYSFFSHTAYNQNLFSANEYPEKVFSLRQLKNGTLALSKNTPFLDGLVKRYSQIDFVIVSSHSEALRKLVDGRVDYALIVDLPSLFLSRELAFLERGNDGNKIFQVGELRPTLGYGYVAKEDDDQILAHVNQSLNNLQLSGRQKEIREHWLGKTEPTIMSKGEKSAQIGGLIFSPLLLVVCTVFFWNHSLQKEVDRRTKELAVQQLQLIQADKMTSLGILVAGVAHEINNPTGLILHNLSTLKRMHETADAVLEEKYQQQGDFFIGGLPYSMLREESSQIFSEMKDGAQRIVQIVDDLKDFARKDSSLLTEPMNLNDVVESSFRLLQSLLKKRLTEVHLNLDKTLPSIRGNSSRIQQVVINLILNAFQASADDEQHIAVRSFVDDNVNTVVLQVVDRGIGIEAKKLPFLCDPFYTTKRDQGGTGLGLSISEKIVQEHQGHLDFRSEIGVGTTVSMYLPIYHEG